MKIIQNLFIILVQLKHYFASNYFYYLTYSSFIPQFIKVEQLVIEEFTSKTFTVNDAPDWSVKKVDHCLNTLTSEFTDSDIFGVFAKTNQINVKTINSLPPHWSANIRLDMVFLLTVDQIDHVIILVDSQQDTFYKEISSIWNICQSNIDSLILYNKNFTHTASTLTLTIKSMFDQDEFDEGIAFKNLFIYVDTCHSSCETCSGPNNVKLYKFINSSKINYIKQDQCLTCPINSIKNNNSCTCNIGFYSHKFTCISSCPSGFIPDSTNKICIIDFCATTECQTCTNKLCSQCVSGKKLLQGQCVSSCPSFAPESSGVCKEILSTLTKDGNYLMRGLFSDNFGESEVYGLGLLTSGFLGNSNKSSGAKVTRCGNKNLLGGAYLSGKETYIQRDFAKLDPHSQIIIGFTLYKIDNWMSEELALQVDGQVKQSFKKTSNDGSSNICGFTNYNDDVTNISLTMPHTSSTLTLKLTNTISQPVQQGSYGIREIYVLIDYCTQNCKSCDTSGCLLCNQGFKLFQKQCYSTCPERTYQKFTQLI